MEVSVMNLFTKKDNVDLAHIGKITKAMADLQGTMQDLLEEGIGGDQSNVPNAVNPAQPEQGQAQPEQDLAQPAPEQNN